MNLWLIFLTGLTIGGLTCLAVQGGLLASVIAAREEEDIEKGETKKHTLWPIVAFIGSKYIAYTLLGFLLGAFGGAINISPQTQTFMQLVAGVYMVAVALNLLNVHPIFRYVMIQPPKFLTRMVRNQSKSKDLFAPALLGAMTIFIPCGTTLAMEALAISSASPIIGAAIMATFILGTIPLFFGIGYLTSRLGDAYKVRFLKFAAFLVLYLGITSVNGSLVALGSPITLQTIAENSPIQISLGADGQTADTSSAEKKDGFQTVDIAIGTSGYTPRYIKVKKDIPVRLNLISNGAYSCASAFRIPSLGIAKNLPPNGRETVEFTPTKSGKITFACSMGMYRGTIEVI